ncbi:MAG TPA: type II toxin-antitoxin system death-on-curing family toxin [Anaeromyxobacteraceae bacterium]|nr:type II toxin-antitoxin system death-on-curing family toxin [Anaeromyxobacteraceae bacterium]
MKDPEFLEIEEVLELHARQIQAFGGSLGLRDRGMLESALAMPRVTFGGDYVHSDLFAMAAAYAFHVAENQPFVDGNKRTGLGAALVFLRLNGYRVVDPAESLYDAMIAIAEHRMDKAGLAEILRTLARPVGDEEPSG